VADVVFNEFNKAVAAERFVGEVVLVFNELSKLVVEGLVADDEDDNRDAFKRAVAKLALAFASFIEAKEDVLFNGSTVMAEVLRLNGKLILEDASLRNFSNAFDVDDEDAVAVAESVAVADFSGFDVVEIGTLVEFNLDNGLVFEVELVVLVFADAAAKADVIAKE